MIISNNSKSAANYKQQNKHNQQSTIYRGEWNLLILKYLIDQ